MPVKPVPDGYHSLNAYLTVDPASEAIEYYKRVFGAKERMRLDMPGGKIGHAELEIGDSVLMLADAFPEMDIKSPSAIGGTPVAIGLYLPDVDAVVARAVDAGAKILSPLTNQFYGDRSAKIQDPFGHIWHVATHIEDVSPEEMQRRADEWAKTNAPG